MDDLNEIVTCVCVYLIASAIFSEASRYLAVYPPRISIEQEIASRKSSRDFVTKHKRVRLKA